MSTSKWAYDPRRCDGQPCPGDCDHCTRWQEDEEEEEYVKTKDVWVTLKKYLKIPGGEEADKDEVIQALLEQIPRQLTCRDCARRNKDCPLQVWCGPQDDDFCSRGVPKE